MEMMDVDHIRRRRNDRLAADAVSRSSSSNVATAMRSTGPIGDAQQVERSSETEGNPFESIIPSEFECILCLRWVYVIAYSKDKSDKLSFLLMSYTTCSECFLDWRFPAHSKCNLRLQAELEGRGRSPTRWALALLFSHLFLHVDVFSRSIEDWCGHCLE